MLSVLQAKKIPLNFHRIWNRACPIFLILILVTLTPLLISEKAYGVVELGANFEYLREVYGAERENKITNRTYSATMAFYFLMYTALEFSYAQSEKLTEEHTEYRLSGSLSGFSVIGDNSSVNTYMYGVGLRQALAGRNAIIRPLISMGYAKQFISSRRDTLFKEESSGMTILVEQDVDKRRYDSAFLAFQLNIRLVGGLSLSGSVRTYFKAFEYDRARDNLRYLAGLSWIF
jgi:hypothetical protein